MHCSHVKSPAFGQLRQSRIGRVLCGWHCLRNTILKIDDYVFIKQGFRFVKISLADILVLEAEDDYTYFVTTKRYILSLSLSAALDRLNHPRMVRVHGSFAVNIRRVDTFDEQTVTLDGHTVPLGKNYKDDFMRSLHLD
ncbi:MAG: LytTR family transcriptional regulator [Rudanella sp.]|nr:LytTR family transcriptional regulator [Rudanella sp.]